MARHRPRHTVEEIEALFRILDKADPRLRLALVLGMELRGGQGMRARRSHCHFPESDAWWVEIPSRSLRKCIPPLTLNDWEREQVREALTTGYLSVVEAVYQRGELSDYYQRGELSDYALFPQGRLRKGKAIVERGDLPLHNTSIADLFHEFERDAGVTVGKGRAWHSLRRGSSDYYDELARSRRITSPRILDHLQGRVRGSAMRERIYISQESEALQQGAAEARRLRPGLAREEGR